MRLGLLGLVLTILPLLTLAGRNEGDPVPNSGSVPRAHCGPHDRTESGLQGQTTLAERMSGAADLGFNCNLELVGQFQGEGASWQMAAFDHCAYYNTRNNSALQHGGTVVVDASDPSHPRATAFLDSRAMLDPWESLKVNKKRRLLGATKGLGGGGDRFFAFYDISDCAHPALLSDVDFADHLGHGGDFAPDGRTYYGTWALGFGLTAVDISDPSQPKELLHNTEYQIHDLFVGRHGTRLYGAENSLAANLLTPSSLLILDVSDIQSHRPNPQIRLISRLAWKDGNAAQEPEPIRIKGRPYILFTDEFGSGGLLQPRAAAAACAQGLPPVGFARLIDISDEKNPTLVSRLMLEVHDPANCAAVLDDSTNPLFWYDSHYCTVDNPHNAKLAACAYFQAGVRVFDIRDPRHPKEIAYYKPPAKRTESRPGSQLAGFVANRDHDWTSSNMRFVRHKGQLDLWFTSQDNGFQIVRFSRSLKAIWGKTPQ